MMWKHLKSFNLLQRALYYDLPFCSNFFQLSDISVNLLPWSSSLCNFFFILSDRSSSKILNTAVPKGSILSPTLSLMILCLLHTLLSTFLLTTPISLLLSIGKTLSRQKFSNVIGWWTWSTWLLKFMLCRIVTEKSCILISSKFELFYLFTHLFYTYSSSQLLHFLWK